MVCHVCGSRNAGAARICATCGAVLSDVPKTQFAYEQAVLPESTAPKSLKGKSLSIASLVLGLTALTPATFTTGIPAVICGAVALRRRRPGRRMAIAGVATGAFGTLVLTFAMLLPLMAWRRERTRVAAVQRNMHAFQAALADYTAEHAGRYPYAGISWEKEDDDGMVLHFKSGSQLAAGVPANPYADDLYREGTALHPTSGSQVPVGIPVNPYTGERYRNGTDFFYRSDDLAGTRLNAVIDRRDARCPFAGLAAPMGVPGTIVILGWSPPEDRDSPTEYAIVGYGRRTAEPMAGRWGRVFFVLHN